MITKVNNIIFEACQKGDFLDASKKFHNQCKDTKECSCRGKNLNDVSMCMISHLQYATMMDDKNLSENILENYVSWRSRELTKKSNPAPNFNKGKSKDENLSLSF